MGQVARKAPPDRHTCVEDGVSCNRRRRVFLRNRNEVRDVTDVMLPVGVDLHGVTEATVEGFVKTGENGRSLAPVLRVFEKLNPRERRG